MPGLIKRTSEKLEEFREKIWRIARFRRFFVMRLVDEWRSVSQINPFTGALIQATNVQRSQAGERDRALQKARDLQKNSAQGMDQFDHQVESSEAVEAPHDHENADPRKRRNRKDQQGKDKPKLDIRA